MIEERPSDEDIAYQDQIIGLDILLHDSIRTGRRGQQALELLREYPLENLGMQHGAWLAKRKALLEGK